MSRNEASLLESIDKSSFHPEKIQEGILRGILERNLGTEYLRNHLQQRDDDPVYSFKKYVPVIQYEDIKDEIHRIANGEVGAILCMDPATEMFTSSGTSGGEHKLFPKIKGNYDESMHYFDLASSILNRDVPGLDTGKALYFHFVRKPGKTRGGLPCYPALTGYFTSSEFRNHPNNFTSPMEVVLCTDSVQSCYCHLLCGLLHSSQVSKLGSFFASAFVRSIRRLEEWWKELCQDIRTGTLNEMISEPSLRESVGKLLVCPNPILAASIEQAFSSTKSLKGIIPSLWPNAKVIDTVITGSMQQYIDVIDHLSGGLPIASTIYASSESYMGINLRPLCRPSDISYMFLPETAYYEFLPADVSEDEKLQNLAVDISNVKLGQEYELVITTRGGLYRYRMGDVFKVSGFHNKAPLFSFLFRKSVLLSIDSDKTDERELHESVTRAIKFVQQKQRGIRLVDYTSYAELSTNPPHYVIFWELDDQGAEVNPSVMEEACSIMETALSVVYRRGRAEKSIGALELRLVGGGTFELIANYTASKGGSIAQFKMPRCIKNPGHLQILEKKVCHSFKNPTLPKYP